MRTTLNIDDEALKKALKVFPGKTKTEIINEALREYARKEFLKGMLKLRGKYKWEGNLREMRRDRTERYK